MQGSAGRAGVWVWGAVSTGSTGGGVLPLAVSCATALVAVGRAVGRAAREAGPLAVSSATALVATDKVTLDSVIMPLPKAFYA